MSTSPNTSLSQMRLPKGMLLVEQPETNDLGVAIVMTRTMNKGHQLGFQSYVSEKSEFSRGGYANLMLTGFDNGNYIPLIDQSAASLPAELAIAETKSLGTIIATRATNMEGDHLYAGYTNNGIPTTGYLDRQKLIFLS